MERRSAQEKEKYQPSYDTTVLSEVSKRTLLVGSKQGLWPEHKEINRYKGFHMKDAGIKRDQYLAHN